MIYRKRIIAIEYSIFFHIMIVSTHIHCRLADFRPQSIPFLNRWSDFDILKQEPGTIPWFRAAVFTVILLCVSGRKTLNIIFFIDYLTDYNSRDQIRLAKASQSRTLRKGAFPHTPSDFTVFSGTIILIFPNILSEIL